MIEVKHISFPSIEQYRNAIRNVRDHAQYTGTDENGDATFDRSVRAPKLKYTGTVKLHGTNAGIVFWPDGQVTYQSRERIITPEDDNAGFAKFAKANISKLKEFCPVVVRNNPVAIFGEWCGGNIQAKVALNQLPKMFVVFGIKDGDVWLGNNDLALYNEPELNIYNIYQFPTYEIEIDFENPEEAQNRLVDITMAVEEECPVGKELGVTGTGEGVVWTLSDNNPGWTFSSKYSFKVKGEKHQNSKVRTVAPVDMERVNSIKEAVDMYLTESRLEQGIDKLRELGKEFDVKSTGDYLKWIVGDVWKEHGDAIEASGLTQKDVNPVMSRTARLWFMDKLNATI